MSRTRAFVLTALAMVAFAANSLLCRTALKHTGIDAASFTSIRIASGAVVLWLIVRLRDGRHERAGSWPSIWATLARPKSNCVFRSARRWRSNEKEKGGRSRFRLRVKASYNDCTSI